MFWAALVSKGNQTCCRIMQYMFNAGTERWCDPAVMRIRLGKQTLLCVILDIDGRTARFCLLIWRTCCQGHITHKHTYVTALFIVDLSERLNPLNALTADTAGFKAQVGVFTLHASKNHLIFFPVRHSPWAPRCVSSALRSDIRLALSDCCFISHAVCQPNKWQQPSTPTTTSPSHSVTNHTSAHLLSIAHPSHVAAKGEIVTRMPLQRPPAVNSGPPGRRTSSFLAKRCYSSLRQKKNGDEYSGDEQKIRGRCAHRVEVQIKTPNARSKCQSLIQLVFQECFWWDSTFKPQSDSFLIPSLQVWRVVF